MTHTFQPGDDVYIGAPSPTKVHWEVVQELYGGALVQLRSPMSGRLRYELPDRLVIHSEGLSA